MYERQSVYQSVPETTDSRSALRLERMRRRPCGEGPNSELVNEVIGYSRAALQRELNGHGISRPAI
jgi:hypothetical protein